MMEMLKKNLEKQAEQEKDLINDTNKITGRDAETLEDALTDLIWEYYALEEKLKECKEQQENDYDPEHEIPEIHGKGISW